MRAIVRCKENDRIFFEIKLLQRGYGVTTLYVTNDPVEAMSVADSSVVSVPPW